MAAGDNVLLEACGLRFDVAGRTLLENIDLTVHADEHVAVIGPNGSGKSTLLRCLYGWHRPAAGTVRLAGQDIGQMAGPIRARAIGVLTQDGESGLGLNIADVVSLGCSSARLQGAEAQKALEEALDAVGLSGWGERRMETLSGGERQRVMAARALAQLPAVLILDEPTNHLDIRHQLDVLAAVRARQGAAVATLHDLNLAARWADRLYLLDRGRIVATGTPQNVLDPAVISRVYGTEVMRDVDPKSGGPRLSFYRAGDVS